MCGIIGLYSALASENILRQACAGLFGLQHRGQESAGLAWLDDESGRIRMRKSMGLVAQSLSPDDHHYGSSQVVVGHCRYSTAGESSLANAQPLRAVCARGSLAIAHNGNISNGDQIRAELQHKGAIFQSTSDTEVILHLIAHRSDLSLKDAFIAALKRIEGGYALVAIIDDMLVIARDPYGIRPLVFGKVGDDWVASSESCAIEQIGGTIVRNVKAGEVIMLDQKGAHTIYQEPRVSLKPCAFEYVYFARPDSVLDDCSVYNARISLGMALARSAPAEADIVCGMPDSGRISAIGYARQLQIPFEEAILRNHFVGRSFILPNQKAREQAVRQKLRPVIGSIEGKNIVVIDDSIVRGTTSKYVINMLKTAGAKAVHMRIASPPVRWPCYYGIDMPNKEAFASVRYTEEELCKELGADSIKWLDTKDLATSISDQNMEVCQSCFTGNYLWGEVS